MIMMTENRLHSILCKYAFSVFRNTIHEVMIMRNEDIPIGFTMELAQHENALSAFSSLTSDQQRQVIDGAKQMKTRQEMRNYVENQFK